MMNFTTPRILGRTGLSVSRIGLAAGYNVPQAAVEKAFHEYGINYFYFETRKAEMRNALRSLSVSHRNKIHIGIQTYDHLGWWLTKSVDKALRTLGTDYADVLYLGWFNKMPAARVIEAALKMKETGKIRFIGMTGHNRYFHGQLAADAESFVDVHMVRYNAAHRGAETDVFNQINKNNPPGMTTYTATRWGHLLDAKRMPKGVSPLTASDCYRFVLSHPAVDMALSGPRTLAELNDGLQALKAGPLSEEELRRIHVVGDFVHRQKALFS